MDLFDPPLRWKIIALAMFWAITLAAWVLLRWLFYDLLPIGVTAYVFVAMVAFALGILLGARETRRALIRDCPLQPPTSYEVAAFRRQRGEAWTRWMIAYALVGAVTAAGLSLFAVPH